MNTIYTIWKAITKIIYDINVDPADYRVIFQRDAHEYWDVPFNYLTFSGNYFQYLEQKTPYPLHRIVAIYDTRGKYLLKRKYDPKKVRLLPQTIEIYPDIPIDRYMTPTQIVRFSWLILQRAEELANKDGAETLEILGKTEFLAPEVIMITTGYFRGSIYAIPEKTLYRGNTPISLNLIKHDLNYQRVYHYNAKPNLKITHKTKKYKITITNQEIKIAKQTHQQPYTTISLEDTKIAVINPKIKLMRYTTIQKPQTYLASWKNIEPGTLIITDYDTILAEK